MSATYPITVLGKSDQNKFLVHSPNERCNQLKIIIRKELPVTAYAIDTHGKELSHFSTTLLGINQEHGLLIIDTSPSKEINQQITTSSKLYCATSIHDVPVEFMVDTPKLATLADRPVFVTKLPEIMARMQRREYFRASVPASVAAVCYIPSDNGPVKLRITDISLGGLAILIEGDLPFSFEYHEVYEHCEIQLSLGESFEIDLEVRNKIDKPSKRNNTVTQVGLAFKGSSDRIENLIQRFIFNIESKRLRTR